MENILNQEGIKRYSNEFCEQLLQEHFSQHDVITGPQILELQEIRQINLFVMKNLLNAWRKETSKIQSPYFNYDAPEVKEAQKEFMNILSRNIAITQENFRPLLLQATQETILLIFSPYDYYTHLINNPKSKSLMVKDLKRISKYVKINQNVLLSIIEQAEERGYQKISKDEAAQLLSEAFEQTLESPEDVDVYIDKFSQVVPLDENVIYGNSKYYGDSEPEVKPQINSRFDAKKPILNDQHSENKQTLADMHRSQKIESIKKSISINQRFMFINLLFDGNEGTFNSVIDYLETLDNKRDAEGFIATQYPFWDHESEEVQEFMEIINKRLD
ncbi:hypothetical protein LVD15_10545 [Fulvivirga maritima]|uniref:hypothetical protein n=1 Tax=Fulvivirga maritima TaxID=2904247 RepID=UPI001F1EF525|nr:hypothetical protein [Fulvivirga maritima]UII28838.1 hypothetical protein LVD15_10545 [Fulvivirga maritima]